MTAFIGRREFITLLGGAAAVAARGAGAAAGDAGESGFCSGSAADRLSRMDGVPQGLREAAMSKARTSRSNTAGPKANTIGCRHSRPS